MMGSNPGNPKNPPLISVIIPVYNTERFLPECLDSILDQTYPSFEIICVDDGSTDGSLQILKQYADKDSRIHVLTQSNQYAGAARNNGLKIASGKYVYFMDSDDFIHPELFDKAIAKAEKTGCEILVFDTDTFDIRTGAHASHSLLNVSSVPDLDCFSKATIPEEILTFSNPAPWTKIYRKDFILKEGLQFQALPSANDVFFTKMAFATASHISAIPEELISYRIGMNDNTQSRKFQRPFYFMDALQALYDELHRRRLYDTLEAAFVNYAVSCFSYELKPYRNRNDRIPAYRTVLEHPLSKVILDDSPVPNVFTKRYQYIQGLRIALQFHDRINTVETPSANIVIESDHLRSHPLFSIIVPACNEEKYLLECLDSIDGQSFRDYELIVIDDGSSDSSLSIAREYAKSHDSLRVFSHKNAGLSIARNNGVKAARGEYLLFVDSDDMLSSDALETISQNLLHRDILFFDGTPFCDEDSETPELAAKVETFRRYYRRTGHYERTTYTGADLFEQFTQNKDYLSSACFQAVRRDFFVENQLWFLPGVLHEDQLFTFKGSLCAASAGYLPQDLYLRRVTSGSIMTSAFTHKNVYGYYRCYQEASAFYYANRDNRDWAPYHTCIRVRLRELLYAARRHYSSLDYPEKLFYLGFSELEKDMFENTVADVSRESTRLERQKERLQKQKERYRTLKSQLDDTEKELRKIRNSRSYRMGRAIAYLPRKIKGAR